MPSSPNFNETERDLVKEVDSHRSKLYEACIDYSNYAFPIDTSPKSDEEYEKILKGKISDSKELIKGIHESIRSLENSLQTWEELLFCIPNEQTREVQLKRFHAYQNEPSKGTHAQIGNALYLVDDIKVRIATYEQMLSALKDGSSHEGSPAKSTEGFPRSSLGIPWDRDEFAGYSERAEADPSLERWQAYVNDRRGDTVARADTRRQPTKPTGTLDFLDYRTPSDAGNDSDYQEYMDNYDAQQEARGKGGQNRPTSDTSPKNPKDQNSGRVETATVEQPSVQVHEAEVSKGAPEAFVVKASAPVVTTSQSHHYNPFLEVVDTPRTNNVPPKVPPRRADGPKLELPVQNTVSSPSQSVRKTEGIQAQQPKSGFGRIGRAHV